MPHDDMGITMRRIDAHDGAERPVRMPAGSRNQMLQDGRQVAAAIDLAGNVAKRKYP